MFKFKTPRKVVPDVEKDNDEEESALVPPPEITVESGPVPTEKEKAVTGSYMRLLAGLSQDKDDEFDEMEKNATNLFKKVPTLQKKAWLPAVPSNSDLEIDDADDEDDTKNKKKKKNNKDKVKSQRWNRSYSVLTALNRVEASMKEEELPLHKISFLKDVMDKMLSAGQIPDLTIEKGEPGRKKLRDRADKLKSSVNKIIETFQDTAELPLGLVNKEETKLVTSCVEKIIEMNRNFAGRVRSNKTHYKDDSSGKYAK